jgi:hypothetical protein
MPVMLMRSLAAGTVTLACSGCALVPTPEPSFPVPPRICEFPLRAELAFAGEWTLEEAGLIGGLPQHRQAVGQLYVTAEPIPNMSDPGPDKRRFCMIYPPPHVEGGPLLTLGSVHSGWRPPSSQDPLHAGSRRYPDLPNRPASGTAGDVAGLRGDSAGCYSGSLTGGFTFGMTVALSSLGDGDAPAGGEQEPGVPASKTRLKTGLRLPVSIECAAELVQRRRVAVFEEVHERVLPALRQERSCPLVDDEVARILVDYRAAIREVDPDAA